jgi:hypothetical protein
MWKFRAATLLCVGTMAAGFVLPAHASTVTYDITLTQTNGTLITGSPPADFTVTSTPFTVTVPASNFLQDSIPSISFTIGAKTYTSGATIQFNGPTVTNFFGFNATVGEDTLQVNSLTSFQLFSTNSPTVDIPSTDGGTVTLNQVPTTPLPATLPLLAGGLGGIGLLGWRRRRKAPAVAA